MRLCGRLQVLEVCVIQVKLPLERPISDAFILLKPVDNLGEDVLERHDGTSESSSRQLLASWRAAVSHPSVHQ